MVAMAGDLGGHGRGMILLLVMAVTMSSQWLETWPDVP